MRKWTVLLLFFSLCIAFSIAHTYAKPAPDLSRVRITHVGADRSGWIPVKEIPSTTVYGEQFYIAVRFTGYPNPNQIFLYQNGHLIPKSKIREPFGRQGIGNPFTGWVYQFAVPISYGNGIIAVQASGVNGGKYYDTVYSVKSSYQQ